jgi:radical SAM superfamily enzyme YgiQ (UPF0313 family)
MDIILCCPVSHKRPTGAEAESSKSDPLALPMGALFLAQSLLKNGFTTTILHDDTENIISKLKEVITSTTIAIGISTFSGGMLAKAIQIAEYIRRNFSDKSIIWGGAHVTATPGQTLEHELVDYVVWGEGEQSLPLLAEAISTGTGFSKIKGIGYKEKGKLILTENMGFTPIGEVLDLPYHLLNMENYARKMLIGGDRWFGVLSSRGCPFLCKFCSNSSSTWPNTTLRYHSYEHIINTINTLVENYGADAIGFEDELTFLHEKRIVELCQALKSLKHNLTYRFSSRADVLSRFSDSTFKLLKDTGFVASGFGIESGSQRVLDFIGKKTTIKQIYEADEKLSQFDFCV